MYTKGGIYIITSRILVVDLLNARLNVLAINGIIISQAHRLTEGAIEVFILRLYRATNRVGFLQAFSQHPTYFNGFSKMENVMKLCFLQKVFLLPRFHHEVALSLETQQPQVIELEDPLTDRMIAIQSALLVALEASLMELRKASRNLDASELTVQNALSKALDVSIRRQLDPIWHRLPGKTKKLVDDIAALRQVRVKKILRILIIFVLDVGSFNTLRCCYFL